MGYKIKIQKRINKWKITKAIRKMIEKIEDKGVYSYQSEIFHPLFAMLIIIFAISFTEYIYDIIFINLNDSIPSTFFLAFSISALIAFYQTY